MRPIRQLPEAPFKDLDQYRLVLEDGKSYPHQVKVSDIVQFVTEESIKNTNAYFNRSPSLSSSSKLVIKIEQQFKDGTIIDWSQVADNLEIQTGTNGFGAVFKDNVKNIKRKVLEELQKQLFKEQCQIEV